MSFILDALKKSENERQRTIGPSLADAPIRRVPNDKPWWAIGIGVLLIVNLAVLVFALTRNKAPAAIPATPPAVEMPAQPAASAPTPAPRVAPVTRTTSSNPSVRSLAEEADVGYPGSERTAIDPDLDPDVYPLDRPDLSAAARVPEGPPKVRPIDPPSVQPLAPQRSMPAEPSEALPTATALIAGGTPLPEMRLDIHVYSNTPADRFVFINMRKYAEGQVIAEGPTVERVTPEGAVLNYQGTRFLLPRQ